MPSQYFQNFPYRGYTLSSSATPGDYVVVTDIFKRVKLRPDLLNNARVYYTYQIKDGDTPESIAYKYYGSVDYFWVVCIVNQITDPLRDWPKSYHNFIAYIQGKYTTIENAMNTVHHYTKTVTKTDSEGNVSTFTSIIDATEYATLSSVVPEVYTFADGSTVTVEKTRGIVDCYTYEDELNESKRTIILLKQDYLAQIRAELETLLSPI